MQPGGPGEETACGWGGGDVSAAACAPEYARWATLCAARDNVRVPTLGALLGPCLGDYNWRRSTVLLGCLLTV